MSRRVYDISGPDPEWEAVGRALRRKPKSMRFKMNTRKSGVVTVEILNPRLDGMGIAGQVVVQAPRYCVTISNFSGDGK